MKKNPFKFFLGGEKGATLVEYLLIAIFLIGATAFVNESFRGALGNWYGNFVSVVAPVDSVIDITDPPIPPPPLPPPPPPEDDCCVIFSVWGYTLTLEAVLTTMADAVEALLGMIIGAIALGYTGSIITKKYVGKMAIKGGSIGSKIGRFGGVWGTIIGTLLGAIIGGAIGWYLFGELLTPDKLNLNLTWLVETILPDGGCCK